MVLQFKKLHLTFSNILEKAINETDLQINIQNFSPFLNIDFIIFYFYYTIYQNIKIIDLMFLVSLVRFQPGCLLNPSSHLTPLNTCWWESTGEYENNLCRGTWRLEIHTFSIEQGWYQFIQMLFVTAIIYLPHWLHKPWIGTNYPTTNSTTWN